MPEHRIHRADLWPEIAPFDSGYLQVDQRNAIYFEQVGNPRGRPVLFLHGGPGAGAGAVHRRFFDPTAFRVVLFDQRGAGRSRPLGETTANTTPHLVADIERLRVHLGVRGWLLFGGSWGSTLAIAYAQAHPERVVGAVLRGVFLGTAREVDWFLYGLARFFPEAWAAFAGHVPPEERGDLLRAYHTRLMHAEPSIHMPAARAWSLYEGSCSTLLPSPEAVASFAEDRTALGLARIEAHYFRNGSFLPEGGLLAGMRRIGHIPAEIVQGRYDMICPPETAATLAAHWPAARLSIVPDAGHSAIEPGIRAALMRALEHFRARPELWP